MNLLVDLLLVIVVSLSVWIGRRNGFIRTFFSLFGSVISFILSSLLSKPLGAWLSEHCFLPILKEQFLSGLQKASETAVEHLDFSNLPASAQSLLSRFGVNFESVREMVSQQSASTAENMADYVATSVVQPIAETAGVALAFVALFILCSVLVRILVRVLDLISRLPILNFSNRFLGMAAGALYGLFIAFLASCLLGLLEGYIRQSDVLFFQSFALNETVLARFLCNPEFLSVFGI